MFRRLSHSIYNFLVLCDPIDEAENTRQNRKTNSLNCCVSTAIVDLLANRPIHLNISKVNDNSGTKGQLPRGHYNFYPASKTTDSICIRATTVNLKEIQNAVRFKLKFFFLMQNFFFAMEFTKTRKFLEETPQKDNTQQTTNRIRI